MGYYGNELMQAVLGYATLTPAWHFGLYYANTDPLADLAAAEIERIPLPVMGMKTETANSTIYANTAEFLVGPLDACTVGGWFLANGAAETEIMWVSTFATPVVITSGNYARFPVDSVQITISNA